MVKRLILPLVCVVLFSCSKAKKEEVTTAPVTPECTSFLGKALFSKPADSLAQIKSDSVLTSLKSKNTLSEDDFVEIGKRLVAINKYKLAIENYTTGLVQYPQSFKLLRYRGHRYLNLRQTENALADLTKAEGLIRNQPDIMEYDLAGKPTDTYQHQIWYHIGICHFFKRDYKACAIAFEKSLANAHGGKNVAGATDWLYNAYQRSGQTDKIPSILSPISLAYDIDDMDYPYYKRLLLFKGLIQPNELVNENKPIDQMPLLEVTKLYGLANWHAYQGNKDKAQALYKIIVTSKEWPAFAVACAELELK